jgi:NADPH-ferrihemoprotein reductase
MTISNQTTFSSAFPVALLSLDAMSYTSSSDIFVLALGVGLAAVYLFRDQLFASKPKTAPIAATKGVNGSGNPRDFIAKMKDTVN